MNRPSDEEIDEIIKNINLGNKKVSSFITNLIPEVIDLDTSKELGCAEVGLISSFYVGLIFDHIKAIKIFHDALPDELQKEVNPMAKQDLINIINERFDDC